MGFNESFLRYGCRITRSLWRRNLAAVLCAVAAGLAGCAPSEIHEVQPGGIFKGAVVADEPLAAQAGMEMLAKGGSAADAVVAAYFTMAVTYPSAASLGGGGVCMVADWSQGAVFVLDFVAPRSSVTLPYGSTAVPANARGMGALHARYGYLDWRTVLARAEQVAQFGEPTTRASAAAYAAGGNKLFANQAAKEIFAPRGRLPGEGHALPQRDLAMLLSEIRLRGAGNMYRGSLADKLVKAVKEAGGSLAHQDLSNFKPSWQQVDGISYGSDQVYVAPPPAGAGLVIGQMAQMLVSGNRYAKADPAGRAHLLAETARMALAGRDRWLADDGTNVQLAELFSSETAKSNMANFNPDSAGPAGNSDNGPPQPSHAPASTGIVALDYLGGAAACNFTAYRPFGSGRVAPGTGILLAPSPEPSDRNPLSLGPAMIFNPMVGSVKFIGTGGDGAEGATALVNVAAATVIGQSRLDRQIRRPRVHHDGHATVWLEEGGDGELLSALTGRGHSVSRVGSLGRVNAIHCPPGYPTVPDKTLCWAVSDPRGFGLAAFPD
jgi:gamma-glutamyltranspeptidase/glutathione hydrolase